MKDEGGRMREAVIRADAGGCRGGFSQFVVSTTDNWSTKPALRVGIAIAINDRHLIRYQN
jgi:hypothetical protein